MRRLMAMLLVFGVLVMSAPAMARPTPDAGVAPVNMQLPTYAECCRMAANQYIASRAQPPTPQVILDARAAQRISINTGFVDRLLTPIFRAMGWPLTRW